MADKTPISQLPAGALTGANVDVNADYLAIDDVSAGNTKKITPRELIANAPAYTPTGTIAATSVQGAIDEVVSDLAASTGSSLVGFVQSGSGAIAEDMQGMIRQLPFVNLLNFCSDAKRAAILAGTQTDVTAELVLAAATKKMIVGPKGNYEISEPVSIESDMLFGGPRTYALNGATFTLTGTGQLLAERLHLRWEGMRITSAVNNLTFVKVTAAYFRFHHFHIIGTGTGQVGIELDTLQGAVPGAVAFCDFDNYLISGVATCFKTTDTSYCNGNKFGSRNCSHQGFTTVFDIQNTGGTQANHFGGYCEQQSASSSIFKPGAGATFSNNTIDVYKDSSSASMDVIDNSAGATVGTNTFIGMIPTEWQESGTVGRQIFTDKVVVRAYWNADQTGVANNTATKVVFDTEAIDTGDCFANGTFTAIRNAYVRVSATGQISDNLAAGDNCWIRIYKNGAAVSTHEHYMQGTSAPSIAVEDILLLAIGDTIDIYIFANGSGTHTIIGSILHTLVSINEI